jgi:outer membrane murein-binding lipoprotein Lpp
MGGALKGRKGNMLWKTALSLVIGISLAAGGAQGQQNKKPAQVAPAVPDLAATMQALEEKLRSTGRVTWTQNDLKFRDGSYVIEQKTFWEEVQMSLPIRKAAH